MPATKPKTKRAAKARAQFRDNGLWRKWDNDPDVEPQDRAFMHNFYYRRRHLAIGTSARRSGRTLKYQIELGDMDEVTCNGLERIYKRDGADIFKEASRDLILAVLGSIDYVGGLPKQYRSMKKQLLAELFGQQKKDDARALRRYKRPSIAA
jgi:hypothetical protein